MATAIHRIVFESKFVSNDVHHNSYHGYLKIRLTLRLSRVLCPLRFVLDMRNLYQTIVSSLSATNLRTLGEKLSMSDLQAIGGSGGPDEAAAPPDTSTAGQRSPAAESSTTAGTGGGMGKLCEQDNASTAGSTGDPGDQFDKGDVDSKESDSKSSEGARKGHGSASTEDKARETRGSGGQGSAGAGGRHHGKAAAHGGHRGQHSSAVERTRSSAVDDDSVDQVGGLSHCV